MARKVFFAVVIVVMLVSFSGCDILQPGQTGNEPLSASGTIAAIEVEISPELGGKVLEINAREGDSVKEGDILFKLDDELLKAQYDQASKAVDAAKASVKAAQAQLDQAKSQYALAVEAAQLADMPDHTNSLQKTQPTEFALPVWYYQKSETIDAAKAEVDKAKASLDVEWANLTKVLQDASNADFISVEKRLAQAQEAYRVAKLTLDQAKGITETPQATEGEKATATPSERATATPSETATPTTTPTASSTQAATFDKVAQEQLDTAKAELDAAQREYDRMLTSSAATNVLEARAHVAIATARYDNAKDQLYLLMTGDNSLQVDLAAKTVTQAEDAVSQAEANQSQAESALNLINLQLAKMVVKAPISGIVLTRNIEVGELASPGQVIFVLANLDTVKMTVYVPEDRYGKIKLQDSVSITVDSYPGEKFTGTVSHISDQAEYTPRNVQTVEGRKSTVYAVDLIVPNLGSKLKPGMPADVVFNP